MLKKFCEIGSILKAKFSFKRDKSPNQNSKSNSKNGKAGSSSGDNSPVQMEEKTVLTTGTNSPAYMDNKITVNNYTQSEKVIQHHKALEAVKKIFTNDAAKRMAKSIKDPLRGQKDCSDIKDFLERKFEAIQLLSSDPKSKNLIESYEQSKTLLQEFIQSEITEDKFIEKWIKISDNL